MTRSAKRTDFWSDDDAASFNGFGVVVDADRKDEDPTAAVVKVLVLMAEVVAVVERVVVETALLLLLW